MSMGVIENTKSVALSRQSVASAATENSKYNSVLTTIIQRSKLLQFVTESLKLISFEESAKQGAIMTINLRTVLSNEVIGSFEQAIHLLKHFLDSH